LAFIFIHVKEFLPIWEQRVQYCSPIETNLGPISRNVPLPAILLAILARSPEDVASFIPVRSGLSTSAKTTTSRSFH
jgi:hypothetical protein